MMVALLTCPYVVILIFRCASACGPVGIEKKNYNSIIGKCKAIIHHKMHLIIAIRHISLNTETITQ